MRAEAIGRWFDFTGGPNGWKDSFSGWHLSPLFLEVNCVTGITCGSTSVYHFLNKCLRLWNDSKVSASYRHQTHLHRSSMAAFHTEDAAQTIKKNSETCFLPKSQTSSIVNISVILVNNKVKVNQYLIFLKPLYSLIFGILADQFHKRN